MSVYYVDETGFTGEDLMAADQPIFAQATNNFSPGETKKIIEAVFGNIQAEELKHSRLSRRPQHRVRICELVEIVAKDPQKAGVWIAHKEFALITLIVDWWLEPLAYQNGLNLYKDGANLGMANMLFYTLSGFWSEAFRRNLLLHFQRMIRTRSEERFGECFKFVQKARMTANKDQSEILGYLWPSFVFLGHEHILRLPIRVLDLALPGLIFIGHKWRERSDEEWELVHDQSSNMAKQKWLWDALSSPHLPATQFQNPAGVASFPMNVSATRFGNSVDEPQLQICDILAGAASAYLRGSDAEDEKREYRDRLAEAGIGGLIMGGLWPSTDVTPEALGMRGWDGSVAIDWIAQHVVSTARRR